MSKFISVYAALQECKLLSKKLERSANETVEPLAISYANGQIKVGGVNKSAKDYIAEQDSKLQSQLDLRKRYNLIKGRIALANCDIINVAGKDYSVYEALMLKDRTYVNEQRDLIRSLRSAYNKSKSTYDKMLEKAENEAYKQSQAYLEGALTPSQEDVKKAVKSDAASESIPEVAITVYKKFFEENKPVATEIKGGALAFITKMEDDLDRFLADVDIRITEFNMTRNIEIED